jgi:glycerol-3-phosphate dehydrogenase
MKRDFGVLQERTFDLIIIGGGIIGASVARDAAMRGLKVLVLEKDDFAAGTTSRSTRLIHGGFRYLQHFEFGLVREDMREREILLKNAPHLVIPLPFLIPLTKPIDRIIMSAGTLLYDILSYDKTVPGRAHYSRKQTMELEPNMRLQNLRGSDLYYDCQIWYAERLCLENIIAAVDNKAVVLNHAKVTGILKDGNTVIGVKVQDMLTGKETEVKSRLVLNAAGHWMDVICAMMYGKPKQMVRRTKGVHLLTPRQSNDALVLYAKADGRLWFVIPWGKYSFIGTTDTDYKKDIEAVYAEKEDVDYIMREAQRVFPNLKYEDIYYTVAGLRSLPDSGNEKPGNVSRAHKTIDHEKIDEIKGMISVLGGKITGGRGIAEEVTNLICKKLDVKVKCSTARTLLPGAAGKSKMITKEALLNSAKDSGLTLETVTYLASVYGIKYSKVIEAAESGSRGKQQLCPHSKDIVGQIWYAVNEECAITVSDFMLRRSGIGFIECQGIDAVEIVGKEMGRMLNWNPEELQKQINAYKNHVALTQKYKMG